MRGSTKTQFAQRRQMKDNCPGCIFCANMIPIGEGDHICEECAEGPVIVVADYAPTENYLSCGGKAFAGMDE